MQMANFVASRRNFNIATDKYQQENKLCFQHTKSNTTIIVWYRVSISLTALRSDLDHHHHHWLDSPWWVLAFLRSFVPSSLLRATLFQFLTSNILMSWSTPSSHGSFGRPTLLTPSGLALNIFLMVLSLFIRTRCPVHANLLTLI